MVCREEVHERVTTRLNLELPFSQKGMCSGRYEKKMYVSKFKRQDAENCYARVECQCFTRHMTCLQCINNWL